MKLWYSVVLMLLASLSWADEFRLSSNDIQAGHRLPKAQVFSGVGCTGGNVSPQLSWQGAPAGTKSFAITVYDPDAPTGSGWWHWLAFNIPATVTSLPANAGNVKAGLVPAGTIQSRTDFGSTGYGGACPPQGHGKHRYQFTVYALKVDSIPLDESASGAMVGYMLNGNSLGSASLEAIYER